MAHTPQLGAKMTPKNPKLEPKWPPRPPNWSQNQSPRPPSWSQSGPKTLHLATKNCQNSITTALHTRSCLSNFVSSASLKKSPSPLSTVCYTCMLSLACSYQGPGIGKDNVFVAQGHSVQQRMQPVVRRPCRCSMH